MSYKDVLDAVHGRTVVVDGISGTVRVRGLWPNRTVWHEPDEVGLSSEAYLARKRLLLGQDWTSCLSEYPERFTELLLRELGDDECDRLSRL